MPPKEINKSRNWGQANKDYLAELINTGKIDITDCSYQNIEQVRDLHFWHRAKLNFRRNFHEYSAGWVLEIEYSGARRRNGGKMWRFILLFFPLFTSTYALPPPVPLRQFQTKRKSPIEEGVDDTAAAAEVDDTTVDDAAPKDAAPEDATMPPRLERKPPAGAKKATKKAESNDVAAVPPPATKPPVNYSVDSTEKHFVSYYVKGKSDVTDVVFLINGVVHDTIYRVTVAADKIPSC